jgi:hypothetical protein
MRAQNARFYHADGDLNGVIRELFWPCIANYTPEHSDMHSFLVLKLLALPSHLKNTRQCESHEVPPNSTPALTRQI